MGQRAVRLAGAAGIVGVVLILITSFVPGSPPAATASVAKIRHYLVDDRSALLAAAFLQILVTPFILWFVVGLREVLRRDRTTAALGTLVLAGIIVTGALAIAGQMMLTAPVFKTGVAESLSADTIRLVYEAQTLLFTATAGGIVTVTGAAFLAMRRTGAFPAGVAWIALLGVLTSFVAMFGSLGAGASGVGFVGLIGFLLFTLVTAGAMATGRTRAPAA